MMSLECNHGSEGIKKMVAGGICNLLTECWHNKPTLGRVRLLTAPFFFPALLPFQRTTDINFVIKICIILVPVCTRLIIES